MSPPAALGELFVFGFAGPALPAWLREFAGRHGLGGVILFDYDVAARRYERNVVDPPQVRRLCAEVAALPTRPLVFVDQEGGKVRRLKEERGFAPLPSAHAFNLLPAPERRALARRSYAELRALGISFNLAPVIDLALNPDNPDIAAVERAYSALPEEVRGNALLLGEVAAAAGLGLCLKHYPGLGGATSNTHETLTDLSGCLDAAQLALFSELAPRLPGEAILVSHGVVEPWEPGCPVSMSAAALGALRRRLPRVLLISDDLQMRGLQAVLGTEEACLQGLRAGLDLLLIGNNLLDEAGAAGTFVRAVAAAAESDPVLARTLAQALARVRERKRLLHGMPAGP